MVTTTVNLTAPIVVSDFLIGAYVYQAGSLVCPSIQIDDCTTGINNGPNGRVNANPYTNPLLLLRCTSYGIGSSNGSNGSVQNAYAAFDGYGFYASEASFNETVPTNPAGGTAQPTYGSVSSPALPPFQTAGSMGQLGSLNLNL